MLSFKHTCCLAIVALGQLTAAGRGQAVPSAFGPGQGLWAGVEYSNIHAGFPYDSDQRLGGIGVFATDHLAGNLSVAGEARFLRFNSFNGETESHYLAGPRYRLPRFGRIQPFAECLFGIGHIQFPYQIGSGTYFAVAPEAEITYRLSRRWALRGTYDYQFWPGSPNVANEPDHAIRPNGFHAGLAFRIH